MSSIRYAYLSDPKNPRRIITIARRLRDEPDGRVMLEYGISINRQPFENDRYPEKMDRFSKSRARVIASGRMEKRNRDAIEERGLAGEIEVPQDTKGTYSLLLHHLAGDDGTLEFVSRAAGHRINQMNQG